MEESLKTMRAVHGTLRESQRIVEDSNATQVSRKMKGETNVIVAPTAITQLYDWHMRIESLKEGLSWLKAGQSRGANAKPLGRDVRQLHAFVKQARENLPES